MIKLTEREIKEIVFNGISRKSKQYLNYIKNNGLPLKSIKDLLKIYGYSIDSINLRRFKQAIIIVEDNEYNILFDYEKAQKETRTQPEEPEKIEIIQVLPSFTAEDEQEILRRNKTISIENALEIELLENRDIWR